jgi:hypothetical protein
VWVEYNKVGGSAGVCYSPCEKEEEKNTTRGQDANPYDALRIQLLIYLEVRRVFFWRHHLLVFFRDSRERHRLSIHYTVK